MGTRRKFLRTLFLGTLGGVTGSLFVSPRAESAAPAPEAVPPERAESFEFISNIRETTISTDALDESIHFYQDHFGFELKRVVELRDPAWRQLWRLPENMWARCALLQVKNSAIGSLRLIQFFPTSKVYTHLPYRTLDTGYGGIDIEVPDMMSRFEGFVVHGHARVTAPIQYEPPGSALYLNESVVVGPTGERIPMVFYREMSKKDEPMSTTPEYTPALAIFQIVENLKSAAEVYLRLGLQITRERETSISSVSRALGVPVDTVYRAYQLANPAERFGRPILVQYLNKTGANLSDISRPPNLGLVLTSFRVRDVDEALQRLQGTEVQVLAAPLDVDNDLYGRTRALVFRHPNGAWVELYS